MCVCIYYTYERKIPFCIEVDIQNPGFLVMSDIRNVYSKFPAASVQRSVSEEYSCERR